MKFRKCYKCGKMKVASYKLGEEAKVEMTQEQYGDFKYKCIDCNKDSEFTEKKEADN